MYRSRTLNVENSGGRTCQAEPDPATPETSDIRTYFATEIKHK